MALETIADPHSVVRPHPQAIWYSEHTMPPGVMVPECFDTRYPFRGVWQGVTLCRLQLPSDRSLQSGAPNFLEAENAPLPWHEGWSWLQKGLEGFFEGEEQPFPWQQLRMDGFTVFQGRVLQACRRIPRGETRTYKDLAEEAGSPKAARAVGQVMASNPFPLFIPCHRVVAADKKIGGFSAPGGADTKRQLLDWESVRN